MKKDWLNEMKSNKTRPEVSEADPQRNKKRKKVTEKCLIELSTAIYETCPEVKS